MKLKVMKEEIMEGTQKAGSIIPARTGAAYLRSIWLRAKDNQLEMMATDANMEFAGRYTAVVEDPGLVGVNGRKLAELMRRMPPGEITMRLDDNGNVLYLEQGRKRYKLPANDPTWFQELAPFPEHYFYWEGEKIKDILERTIYCIADTESLTNITCLSFMALDEDKVESCGLDGQKIALYWFENKDMYKILKENNLLLEKPYLNELKRWIFPGEIKMGISAKKVFFADPEEKEVFSIPLKSGEFPGYRDILSRFENRLNTKITVYREEMLDCLERIALFTTDEFQSVHFKIFDDYLFLDYQGQDTGEAYEEIGAEVSGEVNEIILATRHLISILNHFDSERVAFSLSSSNDPCFITGEQDPGYTCITMPVTIEEETYYTEEEV
ncbi:MAG: DNA polymerase III subunit beta [Desulfonatronovibrionaceae bacterium]